VELVEELVVVLFFFLCFFVDVLLIVFVLELVVLDVFCASSIIGVRSDRPKVAVISFFIVETSLTSNRKAFHLLLSEIFAQKQ